MFVKRLFNRPIITPDMDERIGSNINGPCLIKVPEWVENPLGKYYLYFAHHQGKYIRLAYSERLEGPWKIYGPGTLQLEESFFDSHIASPDIYIDKDKREILMYYHGCYEKKERPNQFTRVALSNDGLNFTARPEILGAPYWRVFRWKGYFYSLAGRGILYRSQDGLTNFEQGPSLFTQNMRHNAVKLSGDTLYVFYSNAHDCPERILMSKITLTPDWKDWKESQPETILEPQMDYEGGNLPLEPSERGAVHKPVRQLRDPAVFEDDGKTYLLYSVAGESGIAIAEIILPAC